MDFSRADDKPRVVVADKDATVRFLNAETLRHDGWDIVGTTNSASELLTLVATEHPRVVLMGAWIKGRYRQAISRIREIDPRCKIVVYSADQSMLDLAEEKADVALRKPAIPNVLRGVVIATLFADHHFGEETIFCRATGGLDYEGRAIYGQPDGSRFVFAWMAGTIEQPAETSAYCPQRYLERQLK